MQLRVTLNSIPHMTTPNLANPTPKADRPNHTYTYRVIGSRTGLCSRPMAFCQTLEQATRAAMAIHAELLAFDAHMQGLGSCVVAIESMQGQPNVKDSADALLMSVSAGALPYAGMNPDKPFNSARSSILPSPAPSIERGC